MEVKGITIKGNVTCIYDDEDTDVYIKRCNRGKRNFNGLLP